MAANEGIALVDRDEEGVDRAFREDVLVGLSYRQKAIPARWLYDDDGSQLFEDITQVEEYYPTRAETEILRERAADFARAIGPGKAVVEFGSGSSVKTPLLFEAMDPAAYVPLDIAGDFLRASAKSLGKQFPDLPIYPVEADFTKVVELPDEVSDIPHLGFFSGSTIGNMVPRTAVDLLRSMRETLGDDSFLLIGMDLVKDPKVLEAAYDDAKGVTAEFNLNLARRINRELGGTIPVEALRHEARWRDDYSRIEMHLVATRALEFEVAGSTFSMAEGESIHTENSHKFSERSANLLLRAGGWTPLDRWLDSGNRYSLVFARAAESRIAP